MDISRHCTRCSANQTGSNQTDCASCGGVVEVTQKSFSLSIAMTSALDNTPQAASHFLSRVGDMISQGHTSGPIKEDGRYLGMFAITLPD